MNEHGAQASRLQSRRLRRTGRSRSYFQQEN